MPRRVATRRAALMERASMSRAQGVNWVMVSVTQWPKPCPPPASRARHRRQPNADRNGQRVGARGDHVLRSARQRRMERECE